MPPRGRFFADCERCLATAVRLYRLAAAAADADAELLALCSVRSFVTRLLAERLRDAPDWPSADRWLDGLFDSTVADDPPSAMWLSGPMVWGRSADTAGPQWAEPFDADLRFAPDGGLASYRLRFGDRDRPPDDTLSTGIPRIRAALAAGTVRWAFEFAKGDGSRSGRPEGARRPIP